MKLTLFKICMVIFILSIRCNFNDSDQAPILGFLRAHTSMEIDNLSNVVMFFDPKDRKHHITIKNGRKVTKLILQESPDTRELAIVFQQQVSTFGTEKSFLSIKTSIGKNVSETNNDPAKEAQQKNPLENERQFHYYEYGDKKQDISNAEKEAKQRGQVIDFILRKFPMLQIEEKGNLKADSNGNYQLKLTFLDDTYWCEVERKNGKLRVKKIQKTER